MKYVEILLIRMNLIVLVNDIMLMENCHEYLLMVTLNYSDFVITNFSLNLSKNDCF